MKNIDVAKQLLNLDLERKIFPDNEERKRKLNIMMYLANNLHIAKTGKPLLESDMYAVEDVVIDPDVFENFHELRNA